MFTHNTMAATAKCRSSEWTTAAPSLRQAQQTDKKEFIFTKYGFHLKRQQSELQNRQLTLQLDQTVQDFVLEVTL